MRWGFTCISLSRLRRTDSRYFTISRLETGNAFVVPKLKDQPYEKGGMCGFLFEICGHDCPEGESMKVSTNQTANDIEPIPWETREIGPAEARSTTRSSFERKFCGVLITVIFGILTVASVVLAHLSGSLVPPDLLRIAFIDLL